MTAPTTQPIPGTEQPTGPAKQPPRAATHVAPFGDDVEAAARRFAAKAQADTVGMELLERYRHQDWWRQVFLRATQLVETEVMGDVLAELRDQGRPLRELEVLLAAEGMPLSDTVIGRRITAARAARAREATASQERASASPDEAGASPDGADRE